MFFSRVQIEHRNPGGNSPREAHSGTVRDISALPSSWNIWAMPTKLFVFFTAVLSSLEYLSKTIQAPEEVVPMLRGQRSSQQFLLAHLLQGRWRLGCMEGLTQAG